MDFHPAGDAGAGLSFLAEGPSEAYLDPLFHIQEPHP